MSEQPEAGDVRDRVRVERPQRVCGVAVQRAHEPDGGVAIGLARQTARVAVEHEARAERLGQEQDVARTRARLRPHGGGVHRAHDGEPVLRLPVPDRVAAGEQRPRRPHALVGRRQDGGGHVVGQVLRERGHGECEQRRAAHGEDVVECVRSGDRAELRGVVHERREEVDREDERALVIEAVDRGVVGWREPDEQVVRLGGDEAGQQALQARGRVFGSAPARRCQLGETEPGRHASHCSAVEWRRARGAGTGLEESGPGPSGSWGCEARRPRGSCSRSSPRPCPRMRSPTATATGRS